jgi:hypothetical protein
MVSEPVLVLFCGGLGGSPIEETLAQALRACARDTLDEALVTGAYAKAILVLDPPTAAAFGPAPPYVEIDIDATSRPFHFGARLAEVIQRHQLERPVYIGCGLPLVKADELAAIATTLAVSEATVVSNNYFSADLVGFVPGSAIAGLELPDNDRILPRFLTQNGLVHQALPRTMANQFDLDTPGDLAILAYAGGAGPNLTAWLAANQIDTAPVARAARMFTDRMAVVMVAGRISTDVLHYLQSETASQTRLYSEERGMQAAGRDISGEARSLLAYHIQAVGIERFFNQLPEMSDAAFIDTRPIFAHLGLHLSRADRFLSDSLQPKGISDPWLRDFTAAAREAVIPIVLGGQSLVTAGLQMLSEAAWRAHDQLEGIDYKAKGRAATEQQATSNKQQEADP